MNRLARLLATQQLHSAPSQTTHSVRLGLQLQDCDLAHAATFVCDWRTALTREWEALHAGQPAQAVLDLYIVVLPTDAHQSPCCLDEITAAHLDLTWLIQGAPSCLTAPAKIPAVLWDPREPSSHDREANTNHPAGEKHVESFVAAVHSSENLCSRLSKARAVVLLADSVMQTRMIAESRYKERMEAMFPQLRVIVPEFPSCWIPSEKKVLWDGESANVDAYEWLIGGRRFFFGEKKDDFEESGLVIYFGSEGKDLSNILLHNSHLDIYSYNAETSKLRLENPEVNKALRKRYFMVEKAKDADVVGIIISNMGIADYIKIVDRMKVIIKKSGKKYYTFVMNKLNPAKLANFMEIDIYVLVACPFNSLIDSKEFYRPVITPFELELALSETRQWSGKVEVDFSRILKLAEEEEKENAALDTKASKDRNSDDEGDVSLITGKVRAKKPISVTTETASSSNALIQGWDSAAAQYLVQRSYQGLVQDIGKTEVKMATEGRSGRAREYQEETE